MREPGQQTDQMPGSPPPASQQIFLSYSRTDRDACIALRGALEQGGLAVFRDEDSIRSGERWMTRLEEALQQCGAFVLLVGRDGIQRWVGAEVQVALSRHFSAHDESQRLPIFPVLLEGVSPEALPPFLSLLQIMRWRTADPVPSALLDAIRARATPFEKIPPVEGNPYLGLNAFKRSDARLFFGRRHETLEAIGFLGDQQQTNPDKLHGPGSTSYHRWLQVAGNSGAGKSSLVNAGLLPMVERGALWARTGYEHWRILGPMLPGADPAAKLAEVFEQGLIAEPAKRDSLVRTERFRTHEQAFAAALKDFKVEGTAYLLVIDQFEELFTFAEESARKQFDKLVANALVDADCPLFLISTVRADFLDRFELLPRLQALNNTHCKHYFLPTISEQGLREVIEEPARLAGLDVREVATAMLDDARDEIGALPLVENALDILWEHREGNRLSGAQYRKQNGIAGMLSSQADALLERIERAIPNGRRLALEVLLRLTRVNNEGPHTRQRATREAAVMIAGDGKDTVGDRVVRPLSGERLADVSGAARQGALRLIITSTEGGQQFVDLIHETLIRARGKDALGKPVGYWPTLYDYIEKNRDRDIHRQQLKIQTERWRESGSFGRFRNVVGLRDLTRYRPLHITRKSIEGQFISRSWRMVQVKLAVIALALGVLGESTWWAFKENLPFGYIFIKPFWNVGISPSLPEMVTIHPGKFMMGCVEGRDDTNGKCSDDEKPAREVTFTYTFDIGKYEVTFLQYDYYVWAERRKGNATIAFPPDAGFGSFARPVVNVSWDESKAYAKWLSDTTGKTYRLPTEAEWEYAARAGTGTKCWWGNAIAGADGAAAANCADCGSQWDGKMTAPVGSFKPNPWGLHDTAGNVFEWVEDAYEQDYAGAPVDGSARAGHATVRRVVRGGSWFNDQDCARAAYRDNGGPDGSLRQHRLACCACLPHPLNRCALFSLISESSGLCPLSFSLFPPAPHRGAGGVSVSQRHAAAAPRYRRSAHG